MRLILPVLAVFILACLPVSAGEKDQIDVTAKLVDIPGKFPPNELYDYAYVMKYEVQGGKLDKQTIYVAHYNPRIPRKKIKDKMKKFVGGKLKKFKVGAVHKMTLDPDVEKIWDDNVIDEYFTTDKKSTRYWCLKADLK